MSKKKVLPVELIGPDLCFCLASRRTARYVTRIYERHLMEVGITSTHFTILAFLKHWPDMTVVDLADRMSMERTTLVRTVNPMKEAKLVLEGETKIGRAVTLKLSALGEKKLEQSQPHWEAAQAEFETLVGSGTTRKLLQLTSAIATI